MPGEIVDDDAASAFVERGYLHLPGAFSPELAAECREVLWRETAAVPDEPGTWTEPVVRLGYYWQEPFRAAANTPRLHAAYDALAGPGRWAPPAGLGTFPVRFPSDEEPGDDGWHVDASFAADDSTDALSARANVASRGRWLLLLFLVSDVAEEDAPTRIRVGSHRDVAALLAPEGEDGLPFMDLAERAAAASEHRPLAFATGRAGDVYLCHPFLVHAAQPHHGTRPRFLAQPPLLPRPDQDPDIDRPDGDHSPVEQAIRQALGR